MSHAEYDNLKALNYSGAKEILKSPAHYKAWLTAEREETPALKMGRLVHLASLQPQVFDKFVRVAPECDRRTTEGKAIWKAFAATLKEGEEAIKQDEMDEVLGIAEGASAAIESIAKGFGQRVAESVFTGKVEGVAVKGRPDLVITKDGECQVIDIKTTMDASPEVFARDVFKYKYHLQAAFYLHMTGAKRFWIVAVEKAKPYEYAVYELDQAALDMGREMMVSACLTYRECSLYDNWPGYSREPKTLSLPKWASFDDK